MANRRTPVIIDTDPGVDDTLAILLAIASPELEILAYIVSFGSSAISWDRQTDLLTLRPLKFSGNTDVESSHINILKTYQVISSYLERHPTHRDRFPNFAGPVKPILAKGSSGPIMGELHSAQYFHGRDGLGGINERHPDIKFSQVDPDLADHPYLNLTTKSGVDVALELIRSYPPRSITYVALGPLTNLAYMFRRDGEMVRNRIGRIVSMGGALDVPGNTSPVAEFNFFADPFAAKELILPPHPSSGLPFDRFVLLPLDITTPHELPFSVYKRRVDSLFHSSASPSRAKDKSPLVHFTSSFLERTREVMLQFGKDAVELHDIVAMWCAIENPPSSSLTLASGWHMETKVFDIERFGEVTRGMVVVDRRQDESAYAPGANRAFVQAALEKSVSEAHEAHSYPAQVEIESAADALHMGSGVSCIVGTPGPTVLLSLLLERVWGVQNADEVATTF